LKKIIQDLLKKYMFLMIIEIFIIAINIYLLTVPSEILGKIIDLLYNIDQNKQLIINTVTMLLGICIFLLIVRVSWKMLDAKIAREIVKYLRDTLFKKMLKTDIEKLQSIKNGELMSYFVKDIKEIRKFISNVFTVIVRFILNFTFVFWAMCRTTNLKLTVITMLPIIVSVIIIFSMIKKLERNYKESRDGYTDLSAYVQESTDSIRTTKAYIGEKKEFKDFYKKNEHLKNVNLKVTKNESLLNVIVNLGMGIGAGLSILYGGKLVLEGQITTGDFVAFNGYIILLYNPIMWIPWAIKHVKKVQVSYKRLDKMFKLEEEKISVKNSNNKELLKGNIEIKNLTFKYPQCFENVLEDINITIQPGKSLGIIGVIGSGKTSLMNLLLKLYKVPNGKIFIDGKDINNISTDTIRNNICYITQDNFLFSASLKENINLFRDIYNDEEIENSTKSSMIYDEILQMNDGINTIIGEKGIDLSGGQKQRVVLARAFLTNSNIVIFDDNFSALDNKTEEHVLKNIKELTKNKTCIIISNRISDIKHCDEIVVLDQGRIVERGVHSELLNNKYKYYEFYKNQAKKSKIDLLS